MGTKHVTVQHKVDHGWIQALEGIRQLCLKFAPDFCWLSLQTPILEGTAFFW